MTKPLQMMNNKYQYLPWMVVLICLIPLIYLGSIYPTLPDIVPIHYDMEGNPNGWGEKSTLILTGILLSTVALGTYFLITNLPKIDPKKTAGQSPELFQKMALAIVVFLSAINLIVAYSTIHPHLNFTKLLLPLIGIFFAFLGNYMRDIKPNYFAGFRTPWALENDDNWKETHRLAGKLWTIGGLLMAMTSLALPPKAGFISFISIIVIITIIPFAFSYRYFKKHQS